MKIFARFVLGEKNPKIFLLYGKKSKTILNKNIFAVETN